MNNARKYGGTGSARDERKGSSETGRVKETRVINSEENERSRNLLNECCLRTDEKKRKKKN